MDGNPVTVSAHWPARQVAPYILPVDTPTSCAHSQHPIFAQHKRHKMLDLDEIRAKLADRRLDVVALAAGIHRNTVSGIRSGKITNPSYKAVKALSDYLLGKVGE